jgi:ribosomal protein S18 acetylase RimI-like enzyme
MSTAAHATIDFALRPCGPDDAPALALIGQATFLETFAGVLRGADIVAHCAEHHGVAHYRALLARPRAVAWLAEIAPDAAPIGYFVLDASTLPVPDPRATDVALERIYVLSRHHGGGAGRALMDRALREARALGGERLLLGVYADNARARAFYERYGFRHVADRRFRVGANTYDDVVLARAL